MMAADDTAVYQKVLNLRVRLNLSMIINSAIQSISEAKLHLLPHEKLGHNLSPFLKSFSLGINRDLVSMFVPHSPGIYSIG
jgi:hypothetical protein